jgi:hypothetical protein
MTVYPYQFYSDQFISLLLRHDFDWKIYKLESKKTKISSAPNIALQYNLLYGTLKNQEVHQYATFSVPSNAYQEGGILLNNILRFRYFNLYYLTLNAGYFYHITPSPAFNGNQNGRFVYGLGFEL